MALYTAGGTPAHPAAARVRAGRALAPAAPRPPLRRRPHLRVSRTSRCSRPRCCGRWRRFELVVDWFEVWSRSYWRDYLGGAGGRVGALVQRALRARSPARLLLLRAARRAPARGGAARRGDRPARAVRRGRPSAPTPRAADPLVLFAGRLIPEKQATLGVAAIALAARADRGTAGRVSRRRPRARGAGGDRRARAAGVVSAPGFADAETVDAEMRRALCMLLSPPAARATAWSSSRRPRGARRASSSPARTTRRPS